MRPDVVERQFARIGARAKVIGEPVGRPRINILQDKDGEFFDIRFAGDRISEVELEVVDVQPKDRHLFLVSRGTEKFRFLCGHDERHWFVAGVPEAARGVRDVRTAKEALQPPQVREAITRKLSRSKNKFKRRNQAYLRQGEWFFIPEPDLHVPEHLVLKNEPLTRGRGQNHMLELAYRTGGTLVYTSARNRAGLTQGEFDALDRNVRLRFTWTRMMRDPILYAQGRVSHPDHATIYLSNWHRVLPNTESESRSLSHAIAFID